MGVHVMAEGAVVSHGPVQMCPRLVWCHSGPSNGGNQKSTSRELLDRRTWKLLDCWAWKLLDRWAWNLSALGAVPGDRTEVRRGNAYE
jgi:hypothetical protein